MKLNSRRIRVADLQPRDRQQMYALYQRHFDFTDRARFESDLAAKHWVIQLVDPVTEEIRGFSTQELLKVTHNDGIVRAIFSGDTIVDPACWGETALMREWGRLSVELMEATHPDPLYWFLISKGYKTYRFLPVFFREFYPRFDADTPAWAKQLVDAIGGATFGEAYDAQRGLFLATRTKDRLRPGVADVTPERLADPHIRFFVERNPGHIHGDELCCLARLTLDNYTSAGVRLLDPENRPQPSRSDQDCNGTS